MYPPRLSLRAHGADRRYEKGLDNRVEIIGAKTRIADSPCFQ
jgi:hypothetical protein